MNLLDNFVEETADIIEEYDLILQKDDSNERQINVYQNNILLGYIYYDLTDDVDMCNMHWEFITGIEDYSTRRRSYVNDSMRYFLHACFKRKQIQEVLKL